MLKLIALGTAFAFAAAVQPGPLQAFLLSRTIASGPRRTLPAALSPVISDGPIALVVLLVLGTVPTDLARLLRAAGGVFLIYLAWSSLRQARAAEATRADNGQQAPRTLLEATVVNLLNPNPYLGWALVLGPALMAAWRQAPANAVALVVSFYATMVVSLAAFIVACGGTRRLGPAVQRRLLVASAVALACLGVWQLAAGLAGMR